jgi:hypothetical protein
MESQQFVPVGLALVQQGKFTEESEAIFSKAQHGLVAFVEGTRKQVNAVAVVTMKVTIRFDAKNEAYYILTDVDHKPPKKPTGVTTAFVAEDADGKLGLWSQKFGTGKGNARQQLLCDEEGKTEPKGEKAC